MVTSQCERSGVFKPPKRRKKLNLEGISSRKCDCSFRLRGYFEKNTIFWWLSMLSGIHNHELESKLGGHLLAGRIKEEYKRVVDMTKNLEFPRNILTDDKTKMQYLVEKLEEHKHVYFTRTNDEETTLEDIFFAHREITLLGDFGMLVDLLSSKLNMHKVVVIERDNALMDVVVKVLPNSSALLYYFHTWKNVRANCITDCRVKAEPKDITVDGKEVKEEKTGELLTKS
ncbi:hypothetical protein MTR_7g010970 [Medicago truncatula]|uniref:Protein FAR1-RELATED SEQUENCE n=1 Tax=Medicago truncatula TaxID=3880 RepID=G7L203_MEDTR|nr:hypothetical protein MTR_7g010970 [Medicago truncatula]